MSIVSELKFPSNFIMKFGTGGSPLKVCDNVIQNLLDSWLDSKIPDYILEIPVHQTRKACHVISIIRKVTTNDSEILKFTGNLAICIS